MPRAESAAKNAALLGMADELERASAQLINENRKDLDAGIATVELLELLGYEVVIPNHVESGSASLSKGLVRRA